MSCDETEKRRERAKTPVIFNTTSVGTISIDEILFFMTT